MLHGVTQFNQFIERMRWAVYYLMQQYFTIRFYIDILDIYVRENICRSYDIIQHIVYRGYCPEVSTAKITLERYGMGG